MTKETVLQNCTVEGTTIKLPNEQLERKLYQEVAKSLELIGGKWKGGKTFGFVFTTDPTELLDQIANGEKRNLKKEFQFFATPEKLANELVYYANLKQHDTKNQDIDHLKEMYKCLSRGGRLVCITSESWVSGTQKKQIDFRKWLDKVEAEIIDIEKGTFKESGTMVGGKIIIINKEM
jgi:hypothetical protein